MVKCPRFTSRIRLVLACLVLGAIGLGGCAQQPQQMAAAGHSKEYFPSSIYGAASRRVVADGQPIPRGGGQYLVGRPYTIAGQTYYPSERRVTQVGLASWYGDAFHGRLTANGEVYDRDSFTAAHPTMPLPSYARVTNLRNHYSMIVRVNDRGPYHSNRVMDVSRRVADALDFRRYGTAKVKVEYVARASLAGSDDAKLAATLRDDGPARADGVEERVMVAEAAPRAQIASLGSYAPAPPRPRPIVEDEREEALQRYRAPRGETSQSRERQVVPARRSMAADTDEDDRSDQTSSIGRRHRAAPKGSERKDVADRGGSRRAFAEVPIPARSANARHGRDDGHAMRIAERELAARVRDARPIHPAAPSLRGPRSTNAGVLPPARPVRLAAVTTPTRRPAPVHANRSRGD